MHKRHSKKAFSLVELSIVILVLSILVAGSLGVSKTSISNKRTQITKERMDTIYKALGNFVAQNKRLPCPAIITISKGSNSGTSTTPNNMLYGQETGAANTANVGTGVCNYSYVSSTNAPNLAYGMVPTIALGLDPDMAEDGFGTKFTYVVDTRFTKASAGTAATDGFEITKSAPSQADTSTTDLSGIQVQGPSGTELLSNKNGVLLLLSHGANKANGFNASGTAQNPAGITDENNNSCTTCSVSGTTSYDRVFIANSTSTNFDDIVLFKTKAQLVKDAGLEFIMCNAAEAATPATNATCGSVARTWATNGNYGDSVPYAATGAVCLKTCGKYGVWSAPITVAKNFAFMYRPSADSASFTSAALDIDNDTMIFDSNVQSGFSALVNSSGVFTAPVNGYYSFSSTTQIMSLGGNNTMTLQFVINGVTYRVADFGSGISDTGGAGNGNLTGSISGVYMAAGQTAKSQVQNYTADGCYIASGGTTFSGFLIFRQ